MANSEGGACLDFCRDSCGYYRIPISRYSRSWSYQNSKIGFGLKIWRLTGILFIRTRVSKNRVKRSLEERVAISGMQDCFADILIPEEDVVELKKGEKKTSKRKFFPGYILVNMELNDDTWHVVKDTPKVTGFIGMRDRPSPVSDESVRLLKTRIDEGN